MWEKIFNHPLMERIGRVKELLRGEFNFELLYTRVIVGTEFTHDEKNSMKDVIRDSYKDLDQAIQSWLNDRSEINIDRFNSRILMCFTNRIKNKVSFFTLNQDLFIERYLKIGQVKWPGVSIIPSLGSYSTLTDSDFVRLPGQKACEMIENNLHISDGFPYVKLHGSYGWKSSDGSNAMVIGTSKKEDIEKEPLLKYYFHIFENAICEQSQKLLIIGYSFGDPHVNEIIANGVKLHGLRLYIIDPTPPKSFFNNLRSKPYGDQLCSGIERYWSDKLRDIFPLQDRITLLVTIEEDEIREAVFS